MSCLVYRRMEESMRIEIVRTDTGDLKRTRWVFEFFTESWREPVIRLDEYFVEHRETKKHRNWEKDKVYLRIGDNRPWRDTAKEVLGKDVPIWPDVELEVKGRIVKAVYALPLVVKKEGIQG